MNTKIYEFAVFGLAVILTGCTTVSKNPQQDIVGVWELTKALNLRPCDAGFVENIKLVFQSDGTLYKIDPKQSKLDASAELSRYSYKIDGNMLIRTKPEQEGLRTPFALCGKTLVITEADGELIHYRKHTSDVTLIPIWAPRTVPFTVNYDWNPPPVDYEKNKREALASLQFVSLTTIQGIPSGWVTGFEDDDGNVLVFIDSDDYPQTKPYGDYCRVDYKGVSKENALRILKSKEQELEKKREMRTTP